MIMNRNIVTAVVILSILYINTTQAAEDAGENYFVEGATWIYKSSTTSYPTIPGTTHKLWLEAEQEIAGHKAMPMWGVQIAADKEVDDGKEHTPKIVTYVHTDGDKVYYLADEKTEEWWLIYDFGIKPGNDISFMGYLWPFGENKNFSATCTDVHPMDGAEDLTLIKLKDNDMPDLDSEESIEWIAGVGNTAGPLYNWFSPILDGWVSTLLEMSVGDRIIYRMPGYTGVNGVIDASNAEIKVTNHEISVIAPDNADIAIYDISGKAYHATGDQIFRVPAGLYIVAVNGRQHKVMVP